MAIPIPADVRELLEAPNYVHLATLRADGSPRNWVVWVGLEDECILVCTSDATWKAKDMRRDPRVALSVTDANNPYPLTTAPPYERQRHRQDVRGRFRSATKRSWQ